MRTKAHYILFGINFIIINKMTQFACGLFRRHEKRTWIFDENKFAAYVRGEI